MRSPKAVQAAILIAFILVLGAGITFTLWTANALTDGFRFLREDVGTWTPAQQEREVLRLRELVGRIALGDVDQRAGLHAPARPDAQPHQYHPRGAARQPEFILKATWRCSRSLIRHC